MKVVIVAQNFRVKLLLPNWLLTRSFVKFPKEQPLTLTREQKKYLRFQLKQISKEYKEFVLVDVEAADGTMVKIIL